MPTLPLPLIAPESTRALRRATRAHLARQCDTTTSRPDGTTFLTVYFVLLLGIPSRLIVGPLGSAGTLANILAMTGSFWWLWNRIEHPRTYLGHSRPIRWTMYLFSLAILASYVVASTRHVAPVEQNSMDSGLLHLTAWVGIFLVASDGIPNFARFEVLLRRISLLGGLEASLGIIQFVTGKSFTDLIQIPGLVSNTVAFGVGDRDGFARPAGTAIHSIEFGVSLTALLPICLHFAMQPDWAGRVRRWFPVVAIAIAIPLSVSRSAVIGAFVILAFLAPTWSRAVRRRAAMAIVALIVGIYVLIPGFLGVFGKLFTGISGDSSALSRTDSYSLAWEFIVRMPVFGRGFMTFLPQYRILDNQYLGVLIETGLIGLASILALFSSGIAVALVVRRHSSEPAVRSLAQSLAASVAATSVGYAFFDAFSFPMATGISFLMLGLVSGLRHLEHLQKKDSNENNMGH